MEDFVEGRTIISCLGMGQTSPIILCKAIGVDAGPVFLLAERRNLVPILKSDSAVRHDLSKVVYEYTSDDELSSNFLFLVYSSIETMHV